jgi:hypothetical protein
LIQAFVFSLDVNSITIKLSGVFVDSFVFGVIRISGLNIIRIPKKRKPII